jgi:predicted enzyme related to lactoylglutathione lyase
MKFKKISTILIWSENYKRLANWYQNTFDLKVNETLTYPDDTGVLFEFPDGGPWLWIGQHSEVKGKNADPSRIMFNISVDSVSDAYEYLQKKNVSFLAKPFLSPSGQSWFATFYDLDGNLVQVIGKK